MGSFRSISFSIQFFLIVLTTLILIISNLGYGKGGLLITNHYKGKEHKQPLTSNSALLNEKYDSLIRISQSNDGIIQHLHPEAINFLLIETPKNYSWIGLVLKSYSDHNSDIYNNFQHIGNSYFSSSNDNEPITTFFVVIIKDEFRTKELPEEIEEKLFHGVSNNLPKLVHVPKTGWRLEEMVEIKTRTYGVYNVDYLKKLIEIKIGTKIQLKSEYSAFDLIVYSIGLIFIAVRLIQNWEDIYDKWFRTDLEQMAFVLMLIGCFFASGQVFIAIQGSFSIFSRNGELLLISSQRNYVYFLESCFVFAIFIFISFTFINLIEYPNQVRKAKIAVSEKDQDGNCEAKNYFWVLVIHLGVFICLLSSLLNLVTMKM